MTNVEVIVHPDPESLAASVAARLVTEIIDAQAARGTAGVVLTGGGMGQKSQEAVATNPASRAVDWRLVDFYWGDERFLPTGDPDRNETQARAALLDRVPVDPSRVHAMPASDGAWGNDVAAAATGHAAELIAVAETQGRESPRFDVLMLGVGPDAHVASLFPGHEETRITNETVVPVRQSPKPPPTRISFTFPLICSAAQVWLVASGAEKADALAEALAETANPTTHPASGAVGQQRTLALIDEAAAAKLPATMRRDS